MEYIEFILWFVGLVVVCLIFGGLQRTFFPHTLANGFMDLEKLKDLCPELFIKKDEEKEEDKPSK
jgi:hypothetical protein